MKSRVACCAALILAGVCGGLSARADCITEFFTDIPKDTARRNCWPIPFVYPARQATREPFATKVANGWERQNLLVDAYFDDNGNKLTDTGRVRVNWILFDAPPQHRVIYVHRAIRPEETSARLATVQTYVASVWQGSSQPPILASSVSGEGWSADRVDIVNKKFLQAIPAPQLPAAAQGGSSSGSGSSTP